jgi:hypothetical protein
MTMLCLEYFPLEHDESKETTSIIQPNIAFKWVPFLFRVRKVSVSTEDPDIGYSDGECSFFSLVPPGKCFDSATTNLFIQHSKSSSYLMMVYRLSVRRLINRLYKQNNNQKNWDLDISTGNKWRT